MDRNRYIDRIRGVSILTVLIAHGVGTHFIQFVSPSLLPYAAKSYYGVVMFFTVSGFLITRNVLRRYGEPSRIDLGQFYAMRFARIVPPLLLFITISLALAYLVQPFLAPSKSLIWTAAYNVLTFQFNSLYLQHAGTPSLRAWAPLWSLSIEEIFYLVFPIACFLTKRRSILICALLATIATGPIYRSFSPFHAYLIWGAADLLAFGCLAAVLVDKFASNFRRLPHALMLGGTVVIALVFAFASPSTDRVLAPSFTALGTALFLSGAAVAPPTTGRSLFGWLEPFGVASYELYIFHMTFLMAATYYVKPSTALGHAMHSAALLMLTLAVCLAISRYYSEPLRRRIRKLYATAALRHAPVIHIDSAPVIVPAREQVQREHVL